eukprot:tig00021035_g17237.t1
MDDPSELLPWLAAWGAGSTSYVGVLRRAERLLASRGISNARWFVPSAFGFVSVAVASAVAGQVSGVAYEATNALRSSWPAVKRSVSDPATISWSGVAEGGLRVLRTGLSADRVQADVILGLIVYKFSGLLSPAPGVLRRFADVAPSDLHRPGRFSKACLPAKDDGYASEAAREVIRRVGSRSGCHSCGTRSAASYHGDHQPPNSLARPNQRQFFYAQCEPCSNMQGGLLSSFNGKGWPDAAPVVSNLSFLQRVQYQPWLPVQDFWQHGMRDEAKLGVKRGLLEGLDAAERAVSSAGAALEGWGARPGAASAAPAPLQAVAREILLSAGDALRLSRAYIDRKMLPACPGGQRPPAPPPPAPPAAPPHPPQPRSIW